MRSLLALAPLLLAPSLAAQCEVQALKGLNTGYKDFFGKSCALDGDRLVVGAFAATTGLPGSVHVFERGLDGIWRQTARLIGSDCGAGDELGNSVGISGDFVIGGAEFHDDVPGSNAGAAYVWQRGADGKWKEVQKLFPSDWEAQDNFGEYVAIEGTVAVVGARFDETAGNKSGAAYVFERNDAGLWKETAKLVGSGAKRNDLSADTLALNGGRIVMSSYRSDSSGPHSGSAYLFEKVDGVWKETAQLVANDGAGELSRGVAIDGDRAVLGARYAEGSGAGYVFEKWNGQWIQTAKLLPLSRADGDWIGEAVAVRGDRIVLSGHFHDTLGSNSGIAYVFELRDGQWVETKALQSSLLSANDNFSFALSLSDTDLLATSPYDAGNVGRAFVFSFDEAACGCEGASGGTATAYGSGLGGANVGTLSTLTMPNPGTRMELLVGGIPNGTTGTLFIGPTRANRLAFGGTILVATNAAPVKLPFRLSAGSATVGWAVPPTLCGITLYAQAVALDATQPLGRALTNGLQLDLGR